MTATVPRRHRRANREAEQNLEDEFAALEHQVHVELVRRPAKPARRRERLPLGERELLPVARPVMKDPLGETARTAKVAANRVAHHVTHADLRARTFTRATGRGVRRAGVRVRDYVRMPKRQLVLERLVAEGDSKKHAKFAARYEQRRRDHLKKVAVGAAVAVAAWLTAWLVLALLIGWLSLPILVVATLVGFAIHGREQMTEPAPAVVAPSGSFRVAKTDPKLSADAIHQAFHHSGIEGVVIERAPHREGPGWESLVKIPVGSKAFDDAAAKRTVIAGNLGLSRELLFLDPVRGERGSEKLVRVWQADRDPMAGDPTAHPLLDPGASEWDLWTRGWPLGVDVRGNPILVPVVDTPFGAIGARPTAGKTFTMLGLGLVVGFAPLFDLDCISFKASDDFRPLKPLVTACGGTYICGADEKAFEEFYRYLKRKRVEMVARYTRLGQLPIEAVPEGKITRALAADPRMGMRPGVSLVDEIQTPLRHKEWGPRILDEVIELARTVRALSFWMCFGMQWVDAKTVEELVRVLGFRFALSVGRYQDSMGILGSAHTPGVADASEIPLSRKGVGIVAGAEDDPTLGSRPAFLGRAYGVDRLSVAEGVKRALAGCRAGQTSTGAQAAALDNPARARLLEVRNGDRYLSLDVLASRLGFGEGLGARREASKLAKDAGLPPVTETRDDGVVARGAKYVDLGQLNGHHE